HDFDGSIHVFGCSIHDFDDSIRRSGRSFRRFDLSLVTSTLLSVALTSIRHLGSSFPRFAGYPRF
ncbi:hypothetical protein, partial [Lysinibacillus agricola]|uniref:hypothetical protein n=1 Tax=Lysinibacillus agricola TaxID=2590012 RepID=UPI003C1405C4